MEFLSMLRGDDRVEGRGVSHYLTIATIYRAVTRIAFDLASAPIVIEKKAGKEWTALEEDSDEFGGVAKVFKNPNAYEGSTALWTRFHMGPELVGESFLLTDYQNFGARPGKTRQPKSFRVLNPTTITREFGDDGIPLSYRANVGRGKVEIYRPDEILDHRFPAPNGEFCGVAPADAVALYSEIEKELATYQRNFLLNGARGSVVLTTDKTMNDQQMQQLESRWSATKGGASNAGAIWVAANGLKPMELIGRRDTDFVDLFRIIKEQVGMTFGVPPAFLADYSKATLANIDEQTPVYVEGTLFPKGRLLEENLTEIVLPRFDPTGQLRARLLWDRVPMIQRMNVGKMISLAPMVNKVLTREEVRVALNYPEVPEIGEFVEPEPMFLPGESAPPPRAARPTVKKWIDDPARHAKRLAAARSVDALELFAARQLRDYIADAEARTLARLTGEGEKSVKALGDDWYDEAGEIAELERVLVRIYTRLVSERGQSAMGEVGDGRFTIDDPEVRRFIEANAYTNGKRITGTAAEALREKLREAVGPGSTIQDIADAIKGAFDGQRSHALTVARTETIRAYNFASVESWRQTGEVESVEWLTAQDDAVRDSHAAMDGAVVALGGTFENGLKFPGDPSGSAEETINCRCTLAPVLVALEERSVRVAPGAFEALFRKELTNERSATHPVASMNGTIR